MPEKYFTPGSRLLDQVSSRCSVTDAGAPRSRWKLTFQSPSTVASSDCVLTGSVCDVAVVVARKTTNTVPHGSSFKGIVVRAPTASNEDGALSPVSARHNSGSLPATGKVGAI